MTGPLIVKKYGNRRLYDTARSTYITHEELADRVRGGTEVRVVDAKTGGDLTQATLAQIILEGRRGADLLPVPLLVQLIRMGDDALAEFFSRYITGALELYLQARQGMSMMPNPFGSQGPFGPGVTNPFAQMFGMPGWRPPAPVQPPPPSHVHVQQPAPPDPDPNAGATHEDVVELRRELEELKSALKRKRG